jgi:uncharacterized membrane protein
MAHLRRPLLSRDRVIAAVILAVAVAIRLWDIRARSLWFDESGEFWIATAPFGHLAHAVQTGSGDPPLYSLLLHLWMGAGTGVAWLRFLSVVFSVLGVLGVMTFARRLGGAASAFAAGILMTVLPPDVRYAQEAGQYALMLGAVAWTLVTLERMRSSPSQRTAALWALTALIASYAYYGAVFAVAIPFACVVVEHARLRDRTRLRTDATAAGMVAIGIVPLLVFMQSQLSRVVAHDVSSGGPGGLFAGGPGAAWTWLRQVIAFQFTGWPYTRVPSAIPVMAALVLLFFAARAHRRVVVWLAATWLVTTLADVVGVFPYGFRWGLVLAPMLVACVSLGIGTSRRSPVRIATLVALTTLALGAVVSLPNRSLRARLYPHVEWAWPETEDAGPVVTYWRANRMANQPTYIYYGAAPAFAYYARGAGIPADLPPTWFLDSWHRGAQDAAQDGIYFGRWLRSMSDAEKVSDVARVIPGHPADLWLVFSHVDGRDDADMLAGILLEGYKIERAYQGVGASAFLLSAR